ncbi:MAG: DUF4178 domain-containing protein [Kofleriaceae bacterium]|nr:DUF4178 domain-containing protein [Kofleriaceae bacterium]
MSAIHANCPSCGGQVSFRIGTSFVTICEYCSTAVARSDRGLEDHGKVIDLIESQSPLDLYLSGSYNGARFEIVGRTQVKHSMGGVWDEWYCAFDSGHWGWLAEAQGHFYMSFKSPLDAAPAYQSLQPGALVPGVGEGNLVVSEMGQAQILGAKGEIPYPLEPNATYYYADLSGPGGVFATLDYGESTPVLYLGKQVTLDEIGIAVSAAAREDGGMSISAEALECPNCRGSLELAAPDQAERVGCPFCGALCDINQGKLKILQILDKDKFPDPLLPLGSKGEFEDHEMIVAGYMVRSTEWHGEFFYWEEYLLYNARIGFRWLTSSDGHWSYVEPVPVADVDQGGVDGPKYKGRSYAAFDTVSSQVEYILGQFYWKVSIGERVSMSDFVNSPCSLSEEKTDSEVTWSLSTYIATEEVEKKFGVTLKPPNAGTVGLNQPYGQKMVFTIFFLMIALSIGAYFFSKSHNKETVVFKDTISFEAAPKSESQVLFTKPFKLEGKRNIQIKAFTPLRNAWVYMQFDLVNEENGSATFFDLPIEHYSGPDWDEGSNTETTYLKAVGSGSYTLRVGVERKNWSKPVTVRVTVTEGVTRFWYWLFLVGFISLLPFFTFFHRRSFEMKRWSDASEPGPWWARNSDGWDSDYD